MAAIVGYQVDAEKVKKYMEENNLGSWAHTGGMPSFLAIKALVMHIHEKTRVEVALAHVEDASGAVTFYLCDFFKHKHGWILDPADHLAHKVSDNFSAVVKPLSHHDQKHDGVKRLYGKGVVDLWMFKKDGTPILLGE